uniref:Rhodanese domain-containing protein n=2 Tax=Biomphalaria glabrata TaxID=6526 RepID=A0A2C9KQ10_BIOGL
MSARNRKSVNPMDKKIPENPKYKHVRSTIDTGASVTKYIEKMEELKRNYNFRKDEIFKRMKVSTFVQLLVQIADLDTVNEDVSKAGDTDLQSDRPDTADQEVANIQKNGAGDSARETSEGETSRSRLEQVVNGLGEIDLETPKPSNKSLPMMGNLCPYLLLDVRERDAYDECHIITAQSYPTAMLARSVNYETKEMLAFKNQQGKIIVLYDDDERLCHRAATTLVQRGYDNLFMLSGGLKVAYKMFPEGLITGTVPQAVLDEVAQPPKSAKSKAQSTARVPATQDSFTPELIDKLCGYLDTSVTDRSTGSRLSTSASSKFGRASSISSASSISTLGRKPFK